MVYYLVHLPVLVRTVSDLEHLARLSLSRQNAFFVVQGEYLITVGGEKGNEFTFVLIDVG